VGEARRATTELRRVHVHVENSRASAPVFRVTPELFAAAVARHGEVGARVEVTFGEDLDGFDAAMQTAEVPLFDNLGPYLAGRPLRNRVRPGREY
jgi:hypothetical protein